MYIDAITRKDEFIIWIRDEDGKLHHATDPMQYHCYQKNTKGTHLSLFGDNLERHDFNSSYDYRNFVNDNRNLFESDIKPLYKMLSEYFYNSTDTIWNVGFFDIEVDFDLSMNIGYPSPENPYGEINSVSLFDVRRQEYHMFMLTHDNPITLQDDFDGLPVVCHNCVTERQLLDGFFRQLEDIDVISGWNSQVFDIQYIVERSVKVYGYDQGITKMNRNGYNYNAWESEDAFKNPYVHYDLVGRVHLDYMAYYKNFVLDPRESYSLDYICEVELKQNKLEYEGDLGELYRTDPQKFFEYSLHDARLLKMLDEKLKFMDMIRGMGRRATCRYSDLLGSIKYLELSIRNYCQYDRDEVIILPDVNQDNKKESFGGGFVLQTIAGGYGWSSSIDLTSLYPSVIRALSMSPETHLLQCMDNKEDYIKVIEQQNVDITVQIVEDKSVIQMKASDIYELIIDNGYTISAYGSIFDPSGQALIPEVLELWYSQRANMKKLSKQCYKADDKEKGDYYDLQQKIAKVGLNSLYGAISNRYCRFYSLPLAASITGTSQMVEKYQIWKCDQLVQEMIDE